MNIELTRPDLICVHCDKIKFVSEPTKEEALEIGSRIRFQNIFHINCKSEGMPKFVYTVGKHGRAFYPVFSLYNPEMGFAFGEQQLFVLEFNGTTTFKEIASRAKQLHLPMLFAYRRFASTETHERFCVSFLLDTPIQSREGAWGVRILLRTIFPESEVSDTDLNKVYLGGDYSIFCDKSIPTITSEMLYNAYCQIQNRNESPKPYCTVSDNHDNPTYFS